MPPSRAKRTERHVTDSYAPLNILAVNQDDRVVLSAQDFEKLLVCRDVVLFALYSKKDVPYRLVEKVMASFHYRGPLHPRKQGAQPARHGQPSNNNKAQAFNSRRINKDDRRLTYRAKNLIMTRTAKNSI
jgi:hypothetical protein